jgi:hypothetical protein
MIGNLALNPGGLSETEDQRRAAKQDQSQSSDVLHLLIFSLTFSGIIVAQKKIGARGAE